MAEASLCWTDVLRAGSFGPLLFGVRHSLSQLQGLKRHALDVRHVEEQILASFRCNEAKTPVCYQAFNRTFSHILLLGLAPLADRSLLRFRQ